MNAAASTGSPFVNVVPGLRVKVHCVQSAFGDHAEATPGSTWPLRVFVTRPVNSACVTRAPSDSWTLYGSIAVGSVMPSRKVPPGLPGTSGWSGVSGKPTAVGVLPVLGGVPWLLRWVQPARLSATVTAAATRRPPSIVPSPFAPPARAPSPAAPDHLDPTRTAARADPVRAAARTECGATRRGRIGHVRGGRVVAGSVAANGSAGTT